MFAIDLTNAHHFNLSVRPHFHKLIDWIISPAVCPVLFCVDKLQMLKRVTLSAYGDQ